MEYDWHKNSALSCAKLAAPLLLLALSGCWSSGPTCGDSDVLDTAKELLGKTGAPHGDIENIRTEARDKDTGTVLCAADIATKSTVESVQKTITFPFRYKAELTSDGDIYVTITNISPVGQFE